jgi:uncharacterized membrane protein
MKTKLILVLCLFIVLAAALCFFAFESAWPSIRIFGWSFGVVLAWLAVFLGRIFAGSKSGMTEEEIPKKIGRMALCFAVTVCSMFILLAGFNLLFPDCPTFMAAGIAVLVAVALVILTWKYAVVLVKW